MTDCVHCGRKVLPAYRWRKADAVQREVWKHAGIGRMAGRGLCPACYPKHKDEYDTSNRSTAELLEEWNHLADPLRPVKEEAARLAPQLGVAEKRLANLIYREIGSRFQGGWGERVKEKAA